MENNTMKRNYTTPALGTIKITTPAIMAGSAARFNNLGGGDINLNPDVELGSDSNDEILSRKFDF